MQRLYMELGTASPQIISTALAKTHWMYGVHAHIYSPKIKVYPLTDGNKKMISF